MLEDCLDYLCFTINQSLKFVFEINDDIAIISPPSSSTGIGNLKTQNKVLIFLCNLEKDTLSKPSNNSYGAIKERTVIKNKPLYMILSIVIAVNFNQTNYKDGLKVLSHILAFFHRHPTFNHQNSPDLPESIEQISMEINNLPSEKLSHMWGMFGSNYLPSCVYQVRTVINNSDTVTGQTGKLSKSVIELYSKES